MQELLKCREQIDEIDQKIARLFQDRMVISGNVAAYKRATGKKVFDKEREDQKIEILRAFAEGRVKTRRNIVITSDKRVGNISIIKDSESFLCVCPLFIVVSLICVE